MVTATAEQIHPAWVHRDEDDPPTIYIWEEVEYIPLVISRTKHDSFTIEYTCPFCHTTHPSPFFDEAGSFITDGDVWARCEDESLRGFVRLISIPDLSECGKHERALARRRKEQIMDEIIQQAQNDNAEAELEKMKVIILSEMDSHPEPPEPAGGRMEEGAKMSKNNIVDFPAVNTGKANTENRLNVISAADLLKMDFPEPRWIVPGIIPEGVSLIAAPPKVGKSWLALDLAVTASIGGVVLGKKVEKTGALYLALEDSPRRLKSRIEKQSSQEPLPLDPRTCHLFTSWAPDGKGFLRLHNYCEENVETRLIIIDTYGRFSSSRDNNDYSEATQILAGIKMFADERGVSIILIHHTRKNTESMDFINQAVGSIGITGGVDNILILNRKRNQPDGVLSITGRDVEEAEFAVHFDSQVCRWSITGDAAEVAESKARQDIIALLKSTPGPMKPKDIAIVLEKNHSTTRVLLMKMVNDGQINKIEEGYISVNTVNTVNGINTINDINGIIPF